MQTRYKINVLLVIFVMGMIGALTQSSGNIPCYWNNEEVTVVVDIPSYKIENLENGTQKINLENFGHLGKSGFPYLPAKVLTFAMPPGTVVKSVNVQGVRTELQGTYNIMPTPPALLMYGNPWIAKQIMNEYKKNKKEAYSSNTIYPQEIGRLEGTGGLRRYNLIYVSIYPFAYRALSGKLYYADKVTVTISYSWDSGKQKEAQRLASDHIADERASEIIYNFDMAKEWYKDNKCSKSLYDYVIITTAADSAACDTLVKWKTSLGYDVKIVTKEWIDSNYTGNDIQQKIRNFLRDKYPAGEWGIKYVLIIGDNATIPMRRCVPFNNDLNGPLDNLYDSPIPTDLYYGDLTAPDSISWNSDGDSYYGEVVDSMGMPPGGDDNPDYNVEVYVGRIPWSDTGKISHICQKIVSFEQNTDLSYKESSLLVGAILSFANENSNGQPLTDGAILMECLMDSGVIKKASAVTLYERAGLVPSSYSCTDSLTKDNIMGYWTNRALFNDVSHGWFNSLYRKIWEWDDGDSIPESNEFSFPMPLESADAPFLDDNYPAVSFLSSCITGYPEEPNNLGAALLHKGSVGIICASRIAWAIYGWNELTDGGPETYDYYFFEKLLKDTTLTHAKMGNALAAARNSYFAVEPYYFLKWMTIYNFNLYGEPSMRHFGCTSGVEESIASQNNSSYLLSSSLPNPFAQQTHIKFHIPVKSHVSLEIYDISGRLIKTLIAKKLIKAGDHEINWDGEDTKRRKVSSGIYFVHLCAGDRTSTKKLILTK